MATGTTSTATPKGAARKGRSASPSKSRAATASKTSEKKRSTPRQKAATPRSSAGSERKRKSSAKTSKASDDVEGIVVTKEVEEYFNHFLLDMLADTSALHNVLRLQYLQCYCLGLMLLASSFSAAITPLPMFVGASNMVQGVTGCLGLAQAFSLTAAAQTSYSGMKKALQYNMFAHLLFAFIVIVHQDPKIQVNTQLVVAISCLNVGLNMWACYFRETTIDIEEESEDLASDVDEH